MKNILATLFRFSINILLKNEKTYLIGMVLVRFTRKFKNNSSIENIVKINNCLGKLTMNIDNNSYMGKSLYWTGYHHIKETIFLNQYLKKDMVFIDIGANQGEFTLFAASKLTNGQVYSFEPVSKLYNRLDINVRNNSFKNVKILKKGLSNENKIVPIYDSLNKKNEGNEGLASTYKSDLRSEFIEEIELINFDEALLSELTRLDFIKIDIEGGELFALKGLEKTIEKFKPTVLIEIDSLLSEKAGYSINDVANYFEKQNYKAFKIFRGKLIEYKGQFDIQDNYVFIYNN